MICPSCRTENEESAEVCFTCRTILAAVTRGSVVDARYEVRRFLGRGGMGTVYEAFDRVLEEPVALKILRSDLAGTPEMARRFRSEIKLARRVSHFNVCRIHEYGEDGPLQYISMELVAGDNLKDVLKRRGALPPDEAYGLAVQVAEGLEAIHQVGVIHRDLKTLNITLDAAGRVRVMDFGIAKRLAAEGGTDPSAAGYVVGSPEYMSPEQARGRPVDVRSDVYSLGVVVYELFAGRVPFHGDTPVATLLLHVEAPPPLDGPEAMAFPAALRPVLRRALAKEPGERYPTAREMAEALRVARGASSSAGTIGGQGAAPVLRLRTWPAAAVVVGTVVALVLAVRALRHPETASPTAGSVLAPVEPPAPVATTTTTTMIQQPAPAVEPVVEPRRSVPATTTLAPARRGPPDAAPTPASEPTSREPARPPPVSVTPATTTPAAPPVTEEGGALLVLVTPWADVSVDGTLIGQTPIGKIPLAAGTHGVVLRHPDYQPFPRKITIRPGETLRLVVNLPTDGVRRPR